MSVPDRPTREQVDDALRRTVPTSVAPPSTVDVFTLAAEVRALHALLAELGHPDAVRGMRCPGCHNAWCPDCGPPRTPRRSCYCRDQVNW